MWPRFCLALLTAALVGAQATPAPQPARTGEGPDLTALGVPRYPGMQLVTGGLGPAPAGPATDGTPVLTGLVRYSTPDPFEQVVRFYEQALGSPEVQVKPKDLSAAHRGQAIPAGATGERRLFQAAPRPSDPDNPDQLRERLLRKAIGRANVLVSDHLVDPQTGAVRAETAIDVMVFH